MRKSNFCVIKPALSWTTKHEGVTDTLALNGYSKTRTKPNFCGINGPADSAGPRTLRVLSPCRKICVTVNSHRVPTRGWNEQL